MYLVFTSVSELLFAWLRRRYAVGVRQAAHLMDFEAMRASLPSYGHGAWVTLELTLAALAIGMLFALPLAVLRGWPSRWISGPVQAFTYVIRGTPLLVQLFLVYYGLAQFEAVKRSVLWPWLSSAWFCAIAAFAINTCAYTIEILHGAMRSVPAGEIEAATRDGHVARRDAAPRRAAGRVPAHAAGLRQRGDFDAAGDVAGQHRDAAGHHRRRAQHELDAITCPSRPSSPPPLIYLAFTTALVGLFHAAERRWLTPWQARTSYEDRPPRAAAEHARASPSSCRACTTARPAPGPKATLQAALHADEIPGLLVAHHLRARLAALEAEGRIVGEIVLVPVANPIGLAQRVLQAVEGRFDLASGENFNRHYADLFDTVASAGRRPAGRSMPTLNVALIRDALREAAAALPARSALESLRRTLLGLSIDADIVLDLHCDSQAVMHLYTETSVWPQVEPLARFLGCEAALLAEVSGDHPFDEACSTIWPRLAARFGSAHADPQRVRGGHGRTARRGRRGARPAPSATRRR